uniref:MFS transporter n=1 Tax=uncultured bacterium pAP3 TaxID=1781154 RepID=A0A1C9U4K2_9BACT|nr:MFS transporter [uncultured bacterium pAP3]
MSGSSDADREPGMAGRRSRLAPLLQALSAYAHPRVRAMLFLGFSAGLPFPLVLTTLSARLRQAGIDRTTIGYFSLVGLAYSLKFFWSPVVDRLPLPLLQRLGRRRSWMLLAQTCIAAGLVAMALHDPAVDAVTIAWLAVFTAFASATQDIALDAYRIEAVGTELQGSMAAAYQVGYQLALIAAGAGALHAAAGYGWSTAYLMMAACAGVGLATTLLIAEPAARIDRATLAQEARVLAFLGRSAHWPAMLRLPTAWLIGAVISPFVDFFARQGLRLGLPALALIVSYRLNYTTMGVAANTFYLDLGYTLDQIALVSKVYGVIMTLSGALMAGTLVKRYGVPRTLLIGWLLLSIANLLYAYVAGRGEHPPAMAWLALVVSIDNIGNGIAGTAFIAYLSSLTSAAYTATQYALFGTLWSLPAKSLASQWGRIVDAFGYPPFFICTAVIGLPALLLVLWLMRRPAGAAPA